MGLVVVSVMIIVVISEYRLNLEKLACRAGLPCQ